MEKSNKKVTFELELEQNLADKLLVIASRNNRTLEEEIEVAITEAALCGKK